MSERTFQCRRNSTCRAWLAESAIEWHISDGNILYVDVLGRLLRFLDSERGWTGAFPVLTD